MGWEADWKKWTQATYGIIHAVEMASRLQFGNFTKLEESVRAGLSWVASNLGFRSEAAEHPLRTGSINIAAGQVPSVLAGLRARAIELLLLGTVSVAEELLLDLLVARSIAKTRPGKLTSGLRAIEKRLGDNGTLTKHRWAISAMHEMRVVRNCVIHARSTWTKAAGEEIKKIHGAAPAIGTPISVGLDDVFRYRRATRTVLNAAARA